MAGMKEKGFRRLNRSHIGTILLFVIIMMIAVHVFTALLAGIFIRYVVDSRVLNEYQSISYMAQLYENSKDASYPMLDSEGRSWFIRSSDGSIIHQTGENTCGELGDDIEMYSYHEHVTVYQDSEIGFVFPKNEGLTVDFIGLFKWLKASGKVFKIPMTNETVELPFWIAVPVQNGTAQFFGKAVFSLDTADIMLIGAFAASICIVVLVMFILMIIYTISSLVKQRRMTALFFMDEVTEDRNWLWFQFKSEHILTKKSNAGNRYAVLDVVVMKYRSFCMLHSIAEGEKILKEIDRVINKYITKKELCAHYASANFAVLLKFTERNELQARIRTLIDMLEQIDTEHKFRFHVGVEPIAIETDKNGNPVRRKDFDPEKEYNNACTARATLDGNDDSAIAFFDDKLVEEQKWVSIVEEEQQKALDNEEFIVYYQPKYDPQTNRLRGAEALIRWNSPKYGFKSPGAFIPIFEKNGFITQIDHYMVRHVAADQRKWLDQGLTCVPVSVNVSRPHFAESDLAEQIRDMVDEAGTPHELIEIELTESAFFDDKNAIVLTIQKLKSFGFAVSMDDFGSGYSSLNSLKDMPLDVLKLDAEFFRGDADGDRAQIVVSEAIRLAKNLNMRTVAEGVEIKDQVDFLASQGCDMIQGYFYAKPMPGGDFEKRMAAGENKETDQTQQPDDM